MKQFIGFFVILLAIPTLFFVHAEIAAELNDAHSFNKQVTTSIEHTAPVLPMPVVMKDHQGITFSEDYAEWRNPLPLSEIPMIVRQLFIESEDDIFYEHRGYDVAAIARAFLMNTASDKMSQGGSTITQQLVRMRFLSTEKTYERKLTELFYAAELEKKMSKDDILEHYLNEMYFSNQVYGIGAAATYYFSRPLSALNIAEIAFIAAIPNNPQLYDPLNNFNRTKERQGRLLDTLVNNGILSIEEAQTYKSMPIELKIKKKINLFPAYSTYVLAELENLIATTEGISIADSSVEIKERTAEVLSTGIVIETAHHPAKQKRDEQAIDALLQRKNLQAGAAVIDNSTREIISLYGGKNYEKANFHRAYQAVRQPGSAMKPLLVYAPLFESGRYTENMPVNSGKLCIGNYCPNNIGGYVYGNTTIKEAFRHSHNTSAVRLFQRVGIEEAFAYLKPFNFQSISALDMNHSAALGGFSKGVTPLELASAYTSFINGLYTPVHAIRSVKDRDGNILYEWAKEKTDVWSPLTVATMRKLLEDVGINGTGYGVPYTTTYTGLKTGTTDQYKDLWAAGLNEHYTTAVWIGYDTPESMQNISDQKIHLRVFSALMK